jgi:diapolycopene oxygenase
MTMKTRPIAIIGSGLAGLSAAVTLAARGHRVTVLERNPWLGGKAAELRASGFRFDMGPTILTLPEVLRRVFAEAGRQIERELELVRLDPQWRCFFEGGDVLDLHEDPRRMEQAIERFAEAGSARGYREFLDISADLHAISERVFLWRSVEDIKDTFDLRDNVRPATLRDVMRIRMGQTVAGVIRRHVKDARVAQMLDHFVQYVGSSPYNSPAVLCSIAHMQTDRGVWYPMGGTRAVPEALVRVAESLGVEFRTSCGVDRLIIEDGRVRGLVTTQGETLHTAAVVSNMDAVRTYRELVGRMPARRMAGRREFEPACSGVVLYLGLDRRYDHLLHHDFVFSRDPEEEFDAIYRRGEPAPDPTCYLAAPAATDPGVAPPGGEALYVLVHTPWLRQHHDWSRLLPAYRRVILDKLSRVAGLEDLESRIVYESALTPQDIHQRYNVLNGAIYGIASHGRLHGAFKPGNRSRDVAGLYLAGGAAHPGPGMPMVLMSGWIAADAVHADLDSAGSPAGMEVAPGAYA